MKQKQLQNLLKKGYMKMNKNNIKYTQEQAVASWVKYLNTIRFENLMNSLNEQDVNLDIYKLQSIKKELHSQRAKEKLTELIDDLEIYLDEINTKPINEITV